VATNIKGGKKMTEQQLARHQKWLRLKYGDIDGEDIFQQACVFAIQEYGIEKTNQNLFGLLCRWAARELFKHRSHEVPFSCLRQENNDQTDEVVFDPEDPTWRKDFDAIEEREEIAVRYGQWLLNALLSATKNSKPAKEKEEKEEQLQFVF
jgi:DNA-directed RNA polymerase specialized sigma24 family protein